MKNEHAAIMVLMGMLIALIVVYMIQNKKKSELQRKWLECEGDLQESEADLDAAIALG